MKQAWINHNFTDYDQAAIKQIQKHHPLFTFVMKSCVRTPNGGWINEPCWIFYQENPPMNYHKLVAFRANSMGHVFILSGESLDGVLIAARMDPTGEIIYSSHRHNSVESTNGLASIDGGRDYVKCDVHPDVIGLDLMIKGDELVVTDDSLLMLGYELKKDSRVFG